MIIQSNHHGAGHVTLKVYDLLGREVATLVDEVMAAGAHTALWNSDQAASGIYYYRLGVDGAELVKNMLLIR